MRRRADIGRGPRPAGRRRASLRARLAATLLPLLLAGPAAAQARLGAPAGAFDLYVLALSWSPGFCATGHRGDAQCAPGGPRGFVVHGLWPQDEAGYPIACGPSGRFPGRADLEAARGLYPSQGLARHEWQQHGTCSGLAPSAYFAAVARAAALVQAPASLDAPAQDAEASPRGLAGAIAAANPGLRPDMIAVVCGRDRDGASAGPMLTEVRVCLTRDLRGFRPCPDEVARGACRAPGLTVPAAP